MKQYLSLMVVAALVIGPVSVQATCELYQASGAWICGGQEKPVATKLTTDESCTLTCPAGHSVAADRNTVTCNAQGDLVVEGFFGVCVQDCTLPDNLHGATWTCGPAGQDTGVKKAGDRVPAGTRCTLECATGNPVGEVSRATCSSTGEGFGDHHFLQCVVQCTIPTIVQGTWTCGTENTAKNANDKVDQNTACTLACATGYTLSGQGTATCDENASFKDNNGATFGTCVAASGENNTNAANTTVANNTNAANTTVANSTNAANATNGTGGEDSGAQSLVMSTGVMALMALVAMLA